MKLEEEKKDIAQETYEAEVEIAMIKWETALWSEESLE